MSSQQDSALREPTRSLARRVGRLVIHSTWADRFVSVATPVALLILWEVAARGGFVDTRFFPAPTTIASSLLDLATSGTLWTDTGASVGRLLAGLALGAVPGIIVGLFMGLNRFAKLAMEPIIAATYPIPKSAIFPLFLLIFGLGEVSKIAIVAVGVFFPVAINTAAGVREISPIYRDVGSNFKAGRWNTFRHIALPGALPLVLTGLQLASGMGLMLIVVAEMLGGNSGLGFLIWNSWQTFSVGTMYAALIVISSLGLLLSLAMVEIERLLVPWRKR